MLTGVCLGTALKRKYCLILSTMMMTMTKNQFLLATAASLPALASSSSFQYGPPSAFLPASIEGTLNQAISSRSRRIADNNNVVAGSRAPATTSSSSSSATPPGKGEFYDDDELFDLLTLHQALNPEDEKGLFGGDIGIDNNVDLDEESIASGGIHDWVLQTLNEDDANSNEEPNRSNGDSTDIFAVPGLHELVLETIDDIDSSSSATKADDKDDNPPTVNQLAYNNLQTLLSDKKPSIRAIATDVDGTLLSGRYLHPTTRDAVLKAIDQAYGCNNERRSNTTEGATAREPPKIQHFFPATGKSRRGAEISLGPAIGSLLYQCPGVYIQGLYCVDKEGNVVFEKKLSLAAVRAAEVLVKDFDISIVGYDGDDLYTTEQTEVVVSLSEIYGEPTVQLIVNGEEDSGSVINLSEHKQGLHKLLLMDEDIEKLAAVRPRLEELAMEYGATVTQAIPTMLELLPEGCSKGYGVNKLCDALGINVSDELLALGDAENDAGMLEDAAIGVAVGNACPMARDAADFIMREHHEEGAAGLAMELFGFDV